MCASRQQVRAYRRTASAWRRYSPSYAVSSPARIRSIRSASDGGRSSRRRQDAAARPARSNRSRCGGTLGSAGAPGVRRRARAPEGPGAPPCGPPWLGTCWDGSPPVSVSPSASPSPSDSSRPSTLIAESPRLHTRTRIPGKTCHRLQGRDAPVRTNHSSVGTSHTTALAVTRLGNSQRTLPVRELAPCLECPDVTA